MAHSRDTAQQVRSEYIDTMSKISYSYFKDYYSKLNKMQVRERGRERERERVHCDFSLRTQLRRTT